MFTVGNYYITNKGRLAKIVSQFKYEDGGHFHIAVQHPDQGWACDRIKVTGQAMGNGDNSITETNDFKGFLTFCTTLIGYDHVTKTWMGKITDPMGIVIINLTGIESQERTLKLLQLGTQEKILTWMQESGYVDEEMDEGAM